MRHLREITPAVTTGEFKKIRFFTTRGRGNRFLRYKEVVTQESSQCNIKIARALFYREVVFAVEALLICFNIYILSLFQVF